MSSPTVLIESIFLTSIVHARENRGVAIVDIRTAYMHTDVNAHIIVYFDRNMAEMLEIIEPRNYKPYIHVDSTGKKSLYAKFIKGEIFYRNPAYFKSI